VEYKSIFHYLGKFLLITFSLCLFACGEHEEIDNKLYLETHPTVLLRELSYCDTKMKFAKVFSAHCSLVTQAFNEYSKYVTERQTDPLAFGDKIIQLQMQNGNPQEIAIRLAVVAASGPE
jgi:hypothetical protein